MRRAVNQDRSTRFAPPAKIEKIAAGAPWFSASFAVISTRVDSSAHSRRATKTMSDAANMKELRRTWALPLLVRVSSEARYSPAARRL
jgi:hypothetical protein